MQTLVNQNQEIFMIKEQPFTIRYARTIMASALIISDLLALSLAIGAAVGLRIWLLGGVGNIFTQIKTVPMLAIILIVFAWQGLYRNGGINPVMELRLTTEVTSIVFLFVSALTLLTQSGLAFSRFVFFSAWLLAIIFLPLFRSIIRALMNRKGLWGEAVAIIGRGQRAGELAYEVSTNPYIGFKPVAVLGDSTTSIELEQLLPFYHFSEVTDVLNYLVQSQIRTIILVRGEISDHWAEELSNTPKNQISNVLIIPKLENVYTVNVRAHDLGSTIGFEIRSNLQSKSGQWIKRGLDLIIVILSSIISLPLGLLFSFLIKIDFPGPIIYKQKRVGKGGEEFEMWKFRTMVNNAQQKLTQYLDENPEMATEWAVNQKLKKDPRITRVGKWLRNLSLDELPQLWNVFKGEMSVVGPRPFMPEQDEHYGEILELYECVPPGITGLWQVSGRNTTTYEKRVALDGYYVKNWSVWLDIYILIRTIWVVIRREGAY